MDKPAGPTSHDVVAVVRRAFGMRRVGHAGTLDPFATGLLPVLLGRATRLMPYLVGLPKRYTGVIRLGTRTATDDPAGEVTATDDGWKSLDDERVRRAMEELTGIVDQVPPAFSAKKVQGRPAHRRARRGEAVALAARTVSVERFVLVGREGPDIRFEASVGSGTYVRALARDLGERLGCGAHLAELRRVTVGPWSVEEAMSLDEIRSGNTDPLPALAAVPHLPKVSLDDDRLNLVRHGRSVPVEDVPAGPVALTAKSELVAIGEPIGGSIRPRVVIV